MMKKYPGHIPVIVDLPRWSKLQLKRRKFLVPSDLILSEFISYVRRYISCSPSISIFFMIGSTYPSMTETFKELYHLYSDKQGILFITCVEENTFG